MPLVIQGTLVAGNRMNGLVDGNAAAPSVSFTNATGTGLYHAGNGVMGVTANSTSVMTVSSNTLTVLSNSNTANVLVLTNSSNASTTKAIGMLFRGTDSVGTLKDIGLISATHSNFNWTNSSLALSTRSAEVLTERMRILDTGNVGIGTSTPASALQVSGNVTFGVASTGSSTALPATKFLLTNDTPLAGTYRSSMYFTNPGAGYGGLVIDHNDSYGNQSWIDGSSDILKCIFGGYTAFTVKPYTGRVGIGTAAPSYPLHVVGTGSGSIGTHGYLQNNATPAVYYGGSASISDVSAYFSNCVSATLYRAFSDRRIKKEIRPLSNGLDKLRRLKPVEYQYIDHITKGTSPAIGFVAQDVAEHLPGAVATTRDCVPDVFMMCTVNLQESVIECVNPRAGELVVHTVRGEKTLRVTTAPNGMRFTPSDLDAEDLKDERVFVFGYKVDDFHVLDKNALFTINVAATQELDHIVRKLEARIVELEAGLSKAKQQTAHETV